MYLSSADNIPSKVCFRYVNKKYICIFTFSYFLMFLLFQCSKVSHSIYIYVLYSAVFIAIKFAVVLFLMQILFQAHNTNKSDVKRCVEHLQNIIRELNVVGADHSAFCKGFFSGVCNCFEAFLCRQEHLLY